jgi:hypothetical protein
MPNVWYVNTTRTTVDLSAAVVSGVAQQTIWEVRGGYDWVPGEVVHTSLWARAGDVVSPVKLAAAVGVQDSADPVPDDPVGDPTYVVPAGGGGPTDEELQQIGDLIPSQGDVLQYRSGTWTLRTPAQIKTDMSLATGDITGLSTALAAKVAATGQTGTVNLTGTALSLPGGVTLKDPADNTKVGVLDVSGVAAGQTRTWSFPNSTGTVVLTANTATLTNKTIDGGSNTLTNVAQSSVTGLTSALTGKQASSTDLTAIAALAPTDGDLMRRWAGAWTSQPLTSIKADMGLDNVTNTSDTTKWSAAATLYNKTFDSVTTRVADSTDATKKIGWGLTGITTGTTRTITVPDANLTMVGTATTQTLTNKTLDTSNNWADATDATKKIGWSLAGITTGNTRTLTVPDASMTLVGTATTQTLTNKTLDTSNRWADATDATKKFAWSLAGITTGTTRTLTVPDADLTLVGTTTTQTLTNKTLDSTTTLFRDTTDTTKKAKFDFSSVATSTTQTYGFPSGSTTLIGYNSTDTLTNKTLSGTQNTITNLQQLAAARHGCKAISLFEPALATSAGPLSTGRIYFCKLVLEEAAPITGIRTTVNAVGSGLTSTSNLMALYDLSGNQLAITADLTATAFVTAGNQDVPFTTPYAAAAGTYLVALLSVGTTPVGIARQGISSTAPYVHNLGLTGVNSRFSSYTTTSQTTLASTLTTGNINGTVSLPLLVGLY